MIKDYQLEPTVEASVKLPWISVLFQISKKFGIGFVLQLLLHLGYNHSKLISPTRGLCEPRSMEMHVHLFLRMLPMCPRSVSAVVAKLTWSHALSKSCCRLHISSKV